MVKIQNSIAIILTVSLKSILTSASSLSLVTNEQRFTECVQCIIDLDKKYCRNPTTEIGTCCNRDDYSTSECNDRLEDVVCSNDLDYEEPNEPNFNKYLICPQSVEVCGDEKELYLQVPDLLASVVDEGFTLDKLMPPGYVCSYNIHLEQE